MQELDALNTFTDALQKSLRDMQEQHGRLANPKAEAICGALALVRQAVIDGRHAVLRELQLAEQRKGGN